MELDLRDTPSFLNSSASQATSTQGQSLGAFVASAAGSSAAAGVQILLFLLIKDKLPRVFQPKTYLVPERERAAAVPPGLWQWVRPIFKTSTTDFLQKCGLDAYFFLRYQLLLLKIFIPIAAILIPTLIPLNLTGGNNVPELTQATGRNLTRGLDTLTISNVAPQRSKRLWAHCVLAVVLIGWVGFTIFFELKRYIRIRQAYLTSPQHRIRASATTVLVRAIPPKWNTVEALDGLFDVFPGGVRNIWINRNYDDLSDKIQKRDKLQKALEGAETDLIKKCRKVYFDRLRKEREEKKRAAGEAASESHSSSTWFDGAADYPGTTVNDPRDTGQKLDDGLMTPESNSFTLSSRNDEDAPAFNPEYDEEKNLNPLWKKYIKEKDRETMRLPIFGWDWMPSLPLMGKKVDTIYYCRREVAKLNKEIEKDQSEPEKFPLMNSAFIQFNNQAAAHMACQSNAHHLPKQMTPRLVEISPDDVIWDNMSIPWWQHYIRTAGILTVIIAMIVLWAVPVAFAGSLSQIDTIRQDFPWLANWLGTAPGWVISIIQGLLPVIIIGALVGLLPILLRFLVKLEGEPTGALVELKVQKYYFAFQFVQVFLVVTVAASLTTIIQLFQQTAAGEAFDVSKIVEILAQRIPTASNYFLSYLLIQGLSVSAGALLQVVNLLVLFLLGPILDSTGRAKFRRQTTLQNIKWGSFFPTYTNLACIGLIYSILSPLILIFNVVTFTLFWIVYRYNTLYVNQFRVDTGGLLFPTAVNQLFTGIYVMEIVLFGFFILVQVSETAANMTGPIIIMLICLVLTVLFQYLLNDAFAPLFRFLPITLEDDAVARDEAFAKLLEARHSIDEEAAAAITGDGAMSNTGRNTTESEDLDDALAAAQRRSEDDDQRAMLTQQIKAAEAIRLDDLGIHRKGGVHQSVKKTLHPRNLNPKRLVPGLSTATDGNTETTEKRKSSWAHRPQPQRDESFGHAEEVLHRHHRHRAESHSPHPPAKDAVAGATEAEIKETVNPEATALPPVQSPRKKQPLPISLDPLAQGGKFVLGGVGGVVGGLNEFVGIAPSQQAAATRQRHRAHLASRIFGSVHDELEDLTPEQRDALVRRAFLHPAVRGRRGCVWVPWDGVVGPNPRGKGERNDVTAGATQFGMNTEAAERLRAVESGRSGASVRSVVGNAEADGFVGPGVAEDEIRNTAMLTRWVWMSNQGQGFDDCGFGGIGSSPNSSPDNGQNDQRKAAKQKRKAEKELGKGSVVFWSAPPDFDERDLIQL